jgi:hypothetical protein
LLPALRAVAATVLLSFWGLAGSTTAGFSILFFGRATFAVARTARAVAVLFAARAGVHREIISFFVSYWYSLFWHCVTIRTCII